MKPHPLVCLLVLVPGFLSQAICQSPDNLRTTPGLGCECIPVSISIQPSSPPTICQLGGIAQFTVTVLGTGPFTYQWRENSVIIHDDSIYSGTNSPVLTIANPPLSFNNKIYRCVITGCNGSCVITNLNAILTVNAMPTDLNHDGVTDVSDFMQFQQQYNLPCSGCPEDFNQDNLVDNYDFLELLGSYNQSCQ